MQGIGRWAISVHNCAGLVMAKVPRLGNLHRYFPKWWHQAEPQTVALENFQPKPEPSSDLQHQSRFEKLADIALHGAHSRDKNTKQAA